MKKYFKESEFKCKCGQCSGGNINLSFEQKLNEARHIANVPFYITSGFRCPIHNENEGGKPNSEHTKGLAVDIRAESSYIRYKILTSLIEVGLTRIGIASNFIHVDMSDVKENFLIWTY